MPGDDLHREAHHQPADEIGAQRAERHRWKHRIEHDAQPPAQPGADRGAASYCKNTAPRHTEFLRASRKPSADELIHVIRAKAHVTVMPSAHFDLAEHVLVSYQIG